MMRYSSYTPIGRVHNFWVDIDASQTFPSTIPLAQSNMQSSSTGLWSPPVLMVGRRVKPYITDPGSGNGTFLNYKRIEPQRYYELKESNVLKFGFSSREYVLLHESSDTSELDRKEDEGDEEKEMVTDS